jgi:hypothetical protein
MDPMKNRIRFSMAIVFIWIASVAPMSGQTHDHAAMMTMTDGEFNPYVVSDKHGGFFIAYVQRKNGLSNVLLQHSRSGGVVDAPVRVNDRPGDGAVRNENPPKVAIAPNDDVYVVWASERERWKGNIRFARSVNGGKTFEPAIDLNSDAFQQPISRAFESITVDAKGRIFVAWIDERTKTALDRAAEIWLVTSEDHGKTFSHDRKILSDVCECCRIALAVDSTGRIYLSYRLVPSTGPMLRDIAVARSDDGGNTFKPSVVSHDGWELNACPIDGATMTIDSADRIHVVWFTQTGEMPRLYIAWSVDHGASFSKPALFDSSQKLAKHAHIVAVPGNRVLLAWDDVNGASIVKWGFFDSGTRSMKVLGTRVEASYPIVALSGDRIGLVALQPNHPELFRIIQTVAR